MTRTPEELLARWMDAEATYRKLVQPLFDGDVRLESLDDAIEIQRARARADKRLDAYVRRQLDRSG